MQEPVRPLPHLADELSGSIELEESCPAVGDEAGSRGGDPWRAGTGVDEDLTLGIGRDARGFTQVRVLREVGRERIDSVEWNLRKIQLRRQRDAESERRRDENSRKHASHGTLPFT